MSAPESSPYLRIDEAAGYARVHKKEIYRACAARRLEHVRVGGRRTIVTRREWIESWLDSLRVQVKAS